MCTSTVFYFSADILDQTSGIIPIFNSAVATRKKFYQATRFRALDIPALLLGLLLEPRGQLPDRHRQATLI